MKIKDLQNMEEKELKAKANELRKELMKLNTQVATGTSIKNAGQIKQLKRTVARIMTVLHQKNE